METPPRDFESDQRRQEAASALHRLGVDYHNRPEVRDTVEWLNRRAGDSKGERIPNEPRELIAGYLGFLATDVNYGLLTGDPDSLEGSVRRATHVTPTLATLNAQREAERSRGMNIPEVKQADFERAALSSSENLHASLKPWAEYLLNGDEVRKFPDWFKMFAFAELQKMRKYDRNRGAYPKRSNHDITAYPEYSPGVLAQVYDWMLVSVEGAEQFDGDGKPRTDSQGRPVRSYNVDNPYGIPSYDAKFQSDLRNRSFRKLMVHARCIVQEGAITEEQMEELRGSWKMYAQGSSVDDLREDLHGFGLDWCTATDKKATEYHLNRGDFHVFYTRDKDEAGDDVDRVPRVAVRMENGKIAEVRGIEPGQAIEPAMIDTVNDKIKDLPGGKEYFGRVRDMKRVTELHRSVFGEEEPELSTDDVIFLSEYFQSIQGFGYCDDPRVVEIREKLGYRYGELLERAFPEILRRHTKQACLAYNEVAAGLGEDMLEESELAEKVAVVSGEWERAGVFAYMSRELQEGTRFTLVAVPNVDVSIPQVNALAKGFYEVPDGLEGVEFSKRLSSYTKRFMDKRGQYQSREISGMNGDYHQRLRLMLVPDNPSVYDHASLYTTDKLAEVKEWVQAKQSENPSLQLRVPSVFESVSYWHALRARRPDMVGSWQTPRYTQTAHVDLQPVAGEEYIPWLDEDPHTEELVVVSGLTAGGAATVNIVPVAKLATEDARLRLAIGDPMESKHSNKDRWRAS
jgi:hypothetical protein